jgi:hypothetical protein
VGNSIPSGKEGATSSGDDVSNYYVIMNLVDSFFIHGGIITSTETGLFYREITCTGSDVP